MVYIIISRHFYYLPGFRIQSEYTVKSPDQQFSLPFDQATDSIIT